MHTPMLRLLVAYALCAGVGVGLSGCGETTKTPSDPGGWSTSEFTDPEPTTNTTDVPDPTTTDPAEDPTPVDLAPDGAPCDDASQCEGGRCMTGPEWPDGYCTTPSCAGSCDSPDSGCVDSDLGNFCAEYCGSNADCREGYGCQSQPGSPGHVCVPVSGLADGEGCQQDGDCAGGVCAQDWPDGFCTTVGCETFEDCNSPGNENNKCLRNRGGNFCVRICTQDSECREGYVCEAFGNGEGMCSPDPSVPFEPSTLEGNPFDLICQSATSQTVTFDYTIAPDTVAYMVTPLAKDGRQLYPNRIDLPAGDPIDLEGANDFQSVPAYLYGGMNPTVVPATNEFTAQLASGDHQYQIQTDSAEICHYVLQESEYGDTIDLNVYFVGIPDLDASTAPTDTNMQAVLAQFDSIWGDAGIHIGKVRYYDITGDDADTYAVLRSDQAVTQLVQLSKRPGDTMDDVLSVNIFFTRAFVMGGAIGISEGLPGPAGLHGTLGSGIAFTSEYLGASNVEPSLGGESVDGNVFTGQILAHEVGHYLGLFHTSEDRGAGYDPLPDTPQCSRISEQCPDLDNLMFPYAGASHVTITPDQQFVLQVNPLTKTATNGGAP